jgi:flagellar hook-basal body complex protein FliE
MISPVGSPWIAPVAQGALAPTPAAATLASASVAPAASASEFAQVLSEVTRQLRATRAEQPGVGLSTPLAEAADVAPNAAANVAAAADFDVAAALGSGEALVRAAPVLVSRAVEAYRELINLPV